MRARTILLFLPLLAALLAAGQTSLAASQPRVALVIGNGAYREAPLKNPANDAADIAATLRRLGFEVILKQNAGLAEMDQAVTLFGKKLRQGGVGLFYFAGHGLQVKGENYLVPVDAAIESESDVRFKCLNAAYVLGKMEDAGNQVNVVILDACRNNPFARSFRSADRGLAKMDAPKGSLIAYATAPGATAADGEGRNGVYTKHLLQNLVAPGLAVHDVFMRTRMGVLKETGEKQVPWESSSLTGYVYFLERVEIARPAPVQPQAPDPNLAAERKRLEEEKQRLAASRQEFERQKAQREERERLEAERAKIEAERERLAAERTQMERDRTRLASLQKAAPVPASPQPAAGVGADYFLNTTWQAFRPNGNPKTAYVRFEPGGRMAYSYKSPQEATHDGTDFWKVEGGRLTITWTNGFAYETYELPGARDQYQGSHTNSGASTLTRVGSGAAPAAPVGEAYFLGTVWKSTRESGPPPFAYVRFDSGNKLSWSYDAPGSLKYDGTDSWRVQGGRLIITWTNGFATESYDLGSAREVFDGSHTKAGRTRLERVR